MSIKSLERVKNHFTNRSSKHRDKLCSSCRIKKYDAIKNSEIKK